MSRIVPKVDLENYRDALTDGEKYIVKYLDEYLPIDYFIYLKTILNWGGAGKTPDIVIAHKTKGICIIEVKDWIYKKENQKIYDNQKSPFKQALDYRTLLLEGIPEIDEEIFHNPDKEKFITASLYFHKSNQQDSYKIIRKTNNNREKISIVSHEILKKDNLKLLVPILNNPENEFLGHEWFDKFENWIMPPEHKILDGTFIKLNKKQEKYIEPRPNTKQKLSGVAGSGKTLILAMRAAKLASEGKKVLIICYNITLRHYIEKQVNRAQYKFKKKNIHIHYFQDFLKRYASFHEIDFPSGFSASDRLQKFFNILREKRLNDKSFINTYDAILIDEGQDFEEPWFKFLCTFLSSNKEVVFAVDEKQNIYEKKINWVGPGRWGVLNQGLRLPKKAIKLANKFAHQFLKEGIEMKEEFIDITEPDVEQLNLLESEDLFEWRNVENFNEAKDKIYKSLKFLSESKSMKLSDIVILVHSIKEGLELKDFILKKYNKKILIKDVFDLDNSRARRKKRYFRINQPELKMCTYHSFKGWESRNIILLIPEISKNIDRQVYTSITRVRQNLIIINQNKKYFNFK